MIELQGYAGSGKTTELVKRANDSYAQGHQVVVLVSRLVPKEVFRRHGLNENIEVISYAQYKKSKKQYKEAKIFIDETKRLLMDILGTNIACVTSNLEDQVLVEYAK